VVRSKTVSGAWVVEQTTCLDELIIEEGAHLEAPDGKVVALSVDGIGREAKPGYYFGDVVISVSDPFMMPPSCIFRESGRMTPLRCAVTVIDGKLDHSKSMAALVYKGEVGDKSAKDIKICSGDPSFNGLLIDGDSEYVIENADIDLEGNGANDFEGVGAGVSAVGNSKVTIRNSEINLNSVTRCAIHAGGNSVMKLENCRLINESPDTGMKPAWVLGLDGTNRAAQLCDNASLEYYNCYIKSNGWGVQSVDGPISCTLFMKDCTVDLSGPRARGYGVFVFGECRTIIDHCNLNVNGYPILMSTERDGYAEITNGSVINAPLYGTMIFRDEAGRFTLDKGSVMNSERASFLVKGSCTNIYIDNAQVNSKQGVILQLMDNDEPGVLCDYFAPPIGEADEYVEGRDLTSGNPDADVFMTISNTELKGDFLNSTTNLKANCRVPKGTHFDLNSEDLNELIAESPGVSQELTAQDDETQGPKNLVLNLKNASVTGIISSAVQQYKEGVTRIDEKNHHQLSNVIQTPAPTVNNGVIVNLEAASKWKVTGHCWLTALYISEDSQVLASRMTVDGQEVPVAPGKYTGKIELE
jgi:hypothetical protein